jgi:hypothetical protein
MLNKIWPWSAINRYKKDAINHAWLVRAAFERGFKSSGDDWRQSWKETPERATLVRWGYIKEDDTWR